MAENDSTNAGWLLYEHADGRHAVCHDGEQDFTHGDPGWHRVGPVEMHGTLAAGGAEKATLSDAKRTLIVDATHAIESTVRAMQVLVDSETFLDEDPYVLRLALRGLWLRIKELNGVSMSIAGGDSLYKVSDGRLTVFGQSEAKREVASC